jgi:hypothetical protein
MVDISIPIEFSTFLVRTNVSQIPIPITESWFLVPSHDFWISIPSTKKENFVHVPCTFSKVAMLNLISILVVSYSKRCPCMPSDFTRF